MMETKTTNLMSHMDEADRKQRSNLIVQFVQTEVVCCHHCGERATKQMDIGNKDYDESFWVKQMSE